VALINDDGRVKIGNGLHPGGTKKGGANPVRIENHINRERAEEGSKKSKSGNIPTKKRVKGTGRSDRD